MDGAKFVERINTLLKEQKKTKAEFYSQLGIANNSITAWGKKNQSPSAEIAYNIARYLGTSVEYLLTGEESDEYRGKYDRLKERVQSAIDEE